MKIRDFRELFEWLFKVRERSCNEHDLETFLRRHFFINRMFGILVLQSQQVIKTVHLQFLESKLKYRLNRFGSIQSEITEKWKVFAENLWFQKPCNKTCEQNN